MRGKGKWRVWMGLVWCGAAACGQDLVLPDKPTSSSTGGPSEGFTGTGGAPDETALGGRLPVPGEPIFTNFGGAGGESGGVTINAGGAPDHQTGAQKGGAGGRPSAAGGGSTTAGGGSTTAGDGNAGAGGAPVGPAALLFSEYVEGSGSFKSIEIYAIEASSLEGCELQTYSNGKLEPTRLALHGALRQGDVHVLCSPALATALLSACDRSTSLTFNGDDALALSCAGQTLDVIGEIGVDPGDSWGVGATLDHTLRRRCEVTGGHSDGMTPFEIDAEWLTLGVDTFSDLGVRNCTP